MVQAERATGIPLQVDEPVRSFIAQFDAAVKLVSSEKLFALVVRNNLKRFVQGLTVSRPTSWATEILSLDRVDANRIAVGVGIKARADGKDQAGTAVFILSRMLNGWMLEDVPHQLFNVK